MRLKVVVYMAKNYLLTYAEQLATDFELLCQNIKAPSNTLFQMRKSSSSVYANIREANYGQSKADFVAKLHIALKETAETEYWLRLLTMSEYITEEMGQSLLTDCLEIKRILIASINTTKNNMK